MTVTHRVAAVELYRVASLDEALDALRLLARTSTFRGSTHKRTDLCAAVSAWIIEREDQIAEIERGAASLLLQAAAEVGRR